MSFEFGKRTKDDKIEFLNSLFESNEKIDHYEKIQRSSESNLLNMFLEKRSFSTFLIILIFCPLIMISCFYLKNFISFGVLFVAMVFFCVGFGVYFYWIEIYQKMIKFKVFRNFLKKINKNSMETDDSDDDFYYLMNH